MIKEVKIYREDIEEVINYNSFPLSLSKQIYQPPEIIGSSYLLEKYSYVYKTENTFWWSLQSLLYYEEIFKEIPIVTFPHYQELNGMPSDFFEGETFYEKRKIDFQNKNRLLLEVNLYDYVLDSYIKHENKSIRHLIKNDITLEGLLYMVSVIPNNIIVKVCDRINHNVGVYRNGLPDLFVWDGKKEYKFVEIKKRYETIKPHQIQWIEYFLSIGVNVEILRVNI